MFGQRSYLRKKYDGVHKWSKCWREVYRSHYKEKRKLCLLCAGEEFLPRRRSFVREG
ncbi:MAG: hypothetical protein ACE5KV_00325 [Thermoplasmata archaeon]